MPSVSNILGIETPGGVEMSNLLKLLEGFIIGGQPWQPSEDDFNLSSFGSDFTHIEVGARMTKEAAESLKLDATKSRHWPDGRDYIAVPLPFFPAEKGKPSGRIVVPPALAKRRDWFPLVKFVTATPCDRKSGAPFYLCCVAGGKPLKLDDVDASAKQRGDGTRSHSVAFYLTHGQAPNCRPGREDEDRPIYPKYLIHIWRSRDDDSRFSVSIQQLTLLRQIENDRVRYVLDLKFLCSFTVQEKDPNDGHGLRVLPADLRQGLTGQWEGQFTDIVRNSFQVMSGKIKLPLYADRYDSAEATLMAAIFGPDWQTRPDSD